MSRIPSIESLPMFSRFALWTSLLLSLVLMIGCGSNVKFGGRVTFSDDDSPLTGGMVCFQAGGFFARGEINADGNYTLGSVTASDGIPKGTYQVYLADTEKIESVDIVVISPEKGLAEAQASTGRNPVDGSVVMGGRKITPRVALKYASSKTSDIQVVVDGKTKRYDFKVERFDPKNP